MTLEISWFYWYNILMKLCEDCGKQLVKRTARWCKLHSYKHRTRPSGLKYILHKENPTSYKKGQKPWNTNTRGLTKANSGSIKKGEHKSVKTQFTTESSEGENNYNWKGDAVGYHALHGWVRRTLGRAVECTECGSNTQVEWANISYEYFREVNDWVQLCHVCHMGRDSKFGWGKAKRRFNR